MRSLRLLPVALLTLAARAQTVIPEALERYALAPDRGAALAGLDDATPTTWYLRVLHVQQSGDRARAAQLLDEWRRWEEAQAARGEAIPPAGPGLDRAQLELRQRLADFGADPAAHGPALANDLGLAPLLPPPADADQGQAQLPSALPADAFTFSAIIRQLRARDGKDREWAFADQLTPAGAARLIDEFLPELPPERIPQLLGQVGNQVPCARRRDAALAWLQAANLPGNQLSHAQRWDALTNTHAARTLDPADLDALADAVPQLRVLRAFIAERLGRVVVDPLLEPATPESALALLDRRATVIERVPADSALGRQLRAEADYARLAWQWRHQGRVDEALLLRWLANRPALLWPWWPAERHENAEARREQDELQRLAGVLLPGWELPPVEDWLRQVLAQGERVDELAAWIDRSRLEILQAEAKLLAGDPDTRRWAEVLGAARFEQWSELDELRWGPGVNRTWLPRENPALTLAVRGAESLRLRVFPLDEGALLQSGREPATDLELDGFVPAAERSLPVPGFERARPWIRREVALDLPELQGAGSWIVEVLAGDRRARCLVRKGSIELLQLPVAEGTLLLAFDAAGEPLAGADLWLDERQFSTDARGRALIPLWPAEAEAPQRLLAVQRATGLARAFPPQIAVQHAQAPAVAIEAILPTELVPGQSVTLPVWIGTGDARLSAAELDARLSDLALEFRPARFRTLAAGEAAAAVIRRPLPASALADGGSWVRLELPVGAWEDAYQLSLSGTWRGPKGELSPLSAVSGQSLVTAAAVADLQRWRLEADPAPAAPGATTLRLRRADGSPKPGQVAQVVVSPRQWFDGELPPVALVSNAEGRIDLPASGPLDLAFRADDARLQLILGGSAEPVASAEPVFQAGQPVVLPWNGAQAELLRDAGGQIAERRTVAVDDHRLTLPADLAPGLWSAQGEFTRLAFVVLPADAQPLADPGLGLRRAPGAVAELTPAPLHLASLSWNEQGLSGQLGGDLNGARVIAVGGHFTPETGAFTASWITERSFARRFWPVGTAGACASFDGIFLGDELRYALERREQPAWPGVALPRGGLLVFEQERGETSTAQQQVRQGETLPTPPPAAEPSLDQPIRALHDALEAEAAQEAAAGGDFAFSSRLRSGDRAVRRGAIDSGLSGDADDLSRDNRFAPGGPLAQGDLRWLAEAPLTVPLELDDQGRFQLPADRLGQRGRWRLVVAGPGQSFARVLDRPATPPVAAPASADHAAALAQARGPQLDFVPAARSADPAAELARIDSLPALAALLRSLGEPAGGDFGLDPRLQPLLAWPQLDQSRRLALVDRAPCWELFVFIRLRDPAWFDAQLRPLIAAKRERGFIDRFLLGEDLRPWLQPDRLARLNAAEQALLARALPDQAQAIAAQIDARVDRARAAALHWRFVEQLLALAATAAPEEAGGGSGLGSSGGGAMAPGTPTERAPRDRRAEAARELTDASALAVPTFAGATHEYGEARWLGLTREQVAAATPGLVPPRALWAALARGEEPGATLLEAALGNGHERFLLYALSSLPFEAPADPAASPAAPAQPAAAPPGALALRRSEVDLTPAPGASALLQALVLGEDGRAVVAGPLVAHRRITLQLNWSLPADPNAEPGPPPLLQGALPAGAISLDPLPGGADGRFLSVAAEQGRFQLSFMLPAAGEFILPPIRLSRGGELLAEVPARTLQVLDRAPVDPASWPQIAARGTTEEVLAYLRTAFWTETDLTLIRWRCRDAAFWNELMALLDQRLVDDPSLAAYGLRHGDRARAARALLAQDGIRQQLADGFQTDWLRFDPRAELTYEHLWYRPFLNARLLPLAGERRIMDSGLAAQYPHFLRVLAHQPAPDAASQLEASAYLLLQDRWDEAIAQFQLAPREASGLPLAWDYLACWIDFAQAKPEAAATRAAAWTPEALAATPLWAERFAAVRDQAAQALGQQPVNLGVAEDRALTARVEGTTLALEGRAGSELELNFFPLDVELSFSATPFLDRNAAESVPLRALARSRVTLDAQGRGRFELAQVVPAELAHRNLLIEARNGTDRALTRALPSTLAVEVARADGLLAVRDGAGRPRPRTYIKVYARRADGTVEFWRDGRTDLRGVFGWADVSGRDPRSVQQFAVLILDDELGSQVLELDPP